MVVLTETDAPSVLRQCLRQAEVERRRGVTIALTELTEFLGVACGHARTSARLWACVCARVRARGSASIASVPIQVLGIMEISLDGLIDGMVTVQRTPSITRVMTSA